MHSKIETLVARLNEKFESMKGYSVSATYGKRYAKLVLNHYGQNSAYMFIDLHNWTVYKPDSWTRPAKGVRYFLLTNDDIDRIVSAADPYGRFLYAR